MEFTGAMERRPTRRDTMTTTTTRSIETATAYIDSQDASNIGWAFRVEYDDGSQESGPMDTSAADETGAIIDELEAVVAAHGGAWSAGSWSYRENDGGAYLWTAE
jgi:hypothetical protein